MLFERDGDEAFDANGEGGGSLAAGAHGDITVGARLFAMPVRNPLNGAVLSSASYVYGVGASVGSIDTAFCVGRVSRIIGSGASQKIRVLFGIN